MAELDIPGVEETHALEGGRLLFDAKLVVTIAEISLEREEAHEQKDHGYDNEKRYHGLEETLQDISDH